jgi:hypothetical protein
MGLAPISPRGLIVSLPLALRSVHGIAADGTLVIASASGSRIHIVLIRRQVGF